MILVTGATGNIGTALLQQLQAPARGVTRDAAQAAFPEGVEVAEADLTRADQLEAVFKGVRSLFLVQGLAPEAPILEAARQAGVEHVVLVSSITVRTHPRLPAAKANLAVEEQLKGSGLDWTILRPTQFASNTLMWASTIREHGIVRAPYVDVGLPTIHPADIAAVAWAALTEDGHRGQTYPLTGPRRITPRGQAADIAAALGRNLEFVEISRAEAHEELAPHLGDETAAAVLDVTGGDVNDDLLAVHDTVARVTGRPAAPFSAWAGANAAAFR